jgi:antirestriction protein ArdC
MAGKTGKAAGARTDVYQEVTDRVTTALEAGTVPWHKPWSGGRNGRPRCMSTGKAYRGVNTLLLGMTATERGYSSPFWGTYRQISELGGQVRKGETSTQVVLYKPMEVRDEAADSRGEDKTRTIPLLRAFRVFNAAQADGLAQRFYPDPQPDHPEDAEPGGHEEAAAMIGSYLAAGGPQLRHVAGNDRACYQSGPDAITLPLASQFESAESYYATLFHECGHSTGHPGRLNRPGIAEFDHFGSVKYAREELAAEMTAAMLCATTGIDGQFDASASYIANWLGALRDDKKLVISAAAQAGKAADLIAEPGREASPETEAEHEPEPESQAEAA